MGKIEAITAIVVGAKEIIEEVSDFLTTSISGDYYKSLDELTFLTNNTLGLSSGGNISDSTRVIGEAICNLSNIIIWGIMLFYAFLSLFQYFLSKKVEVPWKIFIRTIIFGVLVNTSFFICYSAVYFTENVTQYIIGYCGEKTSFSYLEDASSDLGMIIDEEIEDTNILVIENIIKISAYILVFLLNVTVGIRFILLKLIIVFSPIILAFGCNEITEKICFYCTKLFFKLLVYQIIIAVILEIFPKLNFTNGAISQIILISVMLVSIKIAKKIY